MTEKSSGDLIQTRRYGESGPWVVLVHGGPGAPGYMAPVGQALADAYRIVEPFQRAGDRERSLTVQRHIEDMREVIDVYCGNERPALVGHSWGAMLSLAFAAKYPGLSSRLVLAGCGTFDTDARELMKNLRQERTQGERFARLRAQHERETDPDKRLALLGRLMRDADSYDLIPEEAARGEIAWYDALGFEQSWADMMRLQKEGVYPAAFAAVREPVTMLHGDYDAHPGRTIFEGLRKVVADIEYVEFEKCGHYPWLEREAKDLFYAALREVLGRN